MRRTASKPGRGDRGSAAITTSGRGALVAHAGERRTARGGSAARAARGVARKVREVKGSNLKAAGTGERSRGGPLVEGEGVHPLQAGGAAKGTELRRSKGDIGGGSELGSQQQHQRWHTRR